MRSLNVRLLAIIVGIGVVFAIVTYGLNRFQVYRHADFYYKTAQWTKNSNDLDSRIEALKNLQRYVNLCPKDNDVRAEMGSLMVDIAKMGGPKYSKFFGNAFHAFETVLRNDYTRSDVRRNLVEVAMITRRYDDAKEHLDILLQDSPDDAELLTWLGQCQEREDDDDIAAKDSYKKAIASNKHHIEPYIQLANLLRKDADLSASRDLNPTVKAPADDVVNDGQPLDLQTDDAQPAAAKSNEETNSESKPGDKKGDAEKADEKKPLEDKADTKTGETAGDILVEDEDHPDTWMNRMVKANPDSSRAYLQRGQYLLVTRKSEEAANDAAEALKRIPLAINTVGGALGQTAKELRSLAESLPSTPESATAALAELDTAVKQMEIAAKSAADIGGNKETPEEDRAIAGALKDAPKAIRTTGEALVEIAVNYDEDENVAESLKVVTAANDKAMDELEVLNGSLEGALLLLSKCEAENSQSDTARLLATRAHDFYMGSAAPYVLLSRLAERDKDPLKTREWIDLGLDETGDSPELLWRKAKYIIDDLSEASKKGGTRDKMLDELSAVSEKLRTSFTLYGTSPFRGYLSARAAFELGEWAKASKGFESVRNDLALRSPSLALKCDRMSAVCYDRLGHTELAKDAHKRTLKASSSASKYFGEIDKLLSEGKFDAGAEKLNKYIEAGDLPENSWVILAQYYLNVNRAKDNPKKNWATFDKVLAVARKSNPEDARLPLIEADAMIAREESENAYKVLAEACKKYPKDIKCWQALIRLHQKKEDWEAAEKLILDARKELGDSLELRLVEALLLAERDKLEASPALKKLAENLNDYSDADKLRLLSVLAVCARQAGDLELSQQFCRQAVAKDPTNLKVRILLFEISAQKNDAAAMSEALMGIREIEHDGPIWHFYEAMRIASEAEEEKNPSLYDDALMHLAEAKNLRPNWDRIPLLAGTIELRKNNKKAAVKNLREAVDKGSRDTRGIGTLVSLLYESGENEEAQRMAVLLEKQGGRMSNYARLHQAQNELIRGDRDKGVESFRTIAEGSEDFRDHLRLGHILGALAQQAKKRGDKKRTEELSAQAEKSLRKAIELAPQEALVWVSLVQLLSQSGKPSEAAKIIDEARKTVNKQQLSLVLARCFQILGRNPEALQQYKTALQNSDGKDSAARLLAAFYLQNKKSKEAEELLKNIISGKQPASESDIAWTRRQMARLLYSQGGLAKRRDAIEMLNKNLKADSSSADDIREKAGLLATFGSIGELREAEKLTDKLLAIQKPRPADRFLMAKIKLSLNDWPGVTRQMRQLLAEETVQPVWLRFYIDALLDRNEISSAESYLKHLKQIDPKSFSVLKYTARILAGRDQYHKVIELLDKYIKSSPAAGLTQKQADTQKIVRLINATKTLDTLIERLPKTEENNDPKELEDAKVLTAKAEDYWREIAELHPEGKLRLVRFLSRHGKRDEAFDIMDTAWRKGDPSSIATTVVAMIVKGEAAPAQIKRVERIINDASITFGESNQLKLAMAELRCIQRRYEDAEKLYREVLAKNPRNVVALNNLSVFLALRNIKTDESLKLINQAIDIAGAKPVLRDSRASAYIAGNDWERALADLEAAIGGRPTALRLFHQAQAYHGAKQKDMAKASLKKAHKMGLGEDDLQPLERPAYRKLKEVLK